LVILRNVFDVCLIDVLLIFLLVPDLLGHLILSFLERRVDSLEQQLVGVGRFDDFEWFHAVFVDLVFEVLYGLAVLLLPLNVPFLL